MLPSYLNEDLWNSTDTDKLLLSPKNLEASYYKLASKISHDALESTNRILRYCVESEEIGASTALKLNEQQEKLKFVKNNLDKTNYNLIDVEKNLKKLKQPCCLGVFGALFSSVKKKTCFLSKSKNQHRKDKIKGDKGICCFVVNEKPSVGSISVNEKTFGQSSPKTESNLMKKNLNNQDYDFEKRNDLVNKMPKNIRKSSSLSQIDAYKSNHEKKLQDLKKIQSSHNFKDTSQDLNMNNRLMAINHQLYKNMEFVSVSMENIKAMANDMNTKINQKDQLVDSLTRKTDRTVLRVQNAENGGKKILNGSKKDSKLFERLF